MCCVNLCLGFTENLATGFEGTETNPGIIALGLYSGMWSYDGWYVLETLRRTVILGLSRSSMHTCLL